MRNMGILLLFLILSTSSVSQPLAIINDPDGYTNVRKGPGSNFEIVSKIYDNEIFVTDGQIDGWFLVYKISDSYLEGYMHNSRVLPLEQLEKIGNSIARNKIQNINDETINLTIKQIEFVKSNHNYELQDNKWVIKIDGSSPYGVDGGYPQFEIEEITLNIDGVAINFPKTAYSDLYNNNNGDIEIRIKDKDTYFINMANNSDGAGYYNTVWIIKDKKYLKRYVIQI